MRAVGHSIAGVYDDQTDLIGKRINGIEIVGSVSDLEQSNMTVCVAVGDNRVRQRIVEKLTGVHWCEAIIHPAAIVDSTVRIGPGTLVTAGCVIQPDTTIGSHTIVNTRAGIDHDCRVDDFAHVAPGATLAGSVSVGSGAMIGAGATILPGIEIGAWAVVGAGAVVVQHVEAGACVTGIPARARARDTLDG